jgi:hypothetical protein
MSAQPRARWYEQYKVDVPEGEVEGLRVERFEVPEGSFEAMRIALSGRIPPDPGVYTRLVTDRTLWMSDTPAEIADHLDAINRIGHLSCRRVLIHGLGLGMVLKAALACKHVQHVDVVEADDRVIRLVGPHYWTDARVSIHRGDALTFRFPKGARWDVAWHDIWPEISSDNLESMATLNRRYGKRVGWQGAWCQDIARRRLREGY